MRRILLPLLVLLAVSACTKDSARPSDGSSSSGGPRAVAPTSAKFTFEGEGSLATSVTPTDIRCQFPDIEGESIAVLVTLGDKTIIRLSIFKADVVAKVSTGSGSSYAERDFRGSGVTGFSGSEGGTVDATMHEVPVPGDVPKGSIGALTSVQGTVSCGGQRPGSSTLSLTGDLGDLQLNHKGINDPRVECNDADDEIVVLGLLRETTATFLVELGLRADGTSLTLHDGKGGERHFNGPATAAKPKDGQASIEVELLEQAAESPLHSVRIEGRLTCGTRVG